MNFPDTVTYMFFDFVWLKIDEDGNSPGMGQVIGILFKPTGHLYQVQWGIDRIGYHYDEELCAEKPNVFFT